MGGGGSPNTEINAPSAENPKLSNFLSLKPLEGHNVPLPASPAARNSASPVHSTSLKKILFSHTVACGTTVNQTRDELWSLRTLLRVVWMLRFYVLDINQLSLLTPFYSVLLSISVLTALSTLFYSINSSDNISLSQSVLLVLFLPHLPFQHYLCLRRSP